MHIGIGVGILGGGGSITPWYQAGGTPAPVLVYQPKGAASYAASLVNVINPGTYNAAKLIADPTWSAGVGWTMGYQKWLDTGYTPPSKNITVLIAATSDKYTTEYISFFGTHGTSFPTTSWNLQFNLPGNYLDLTIGKIKASGGLYTNGANAYNNVLVNYILNPNGIYIDGVLATTGGTAGNAAADNSFYVGAVHFGATIDGWATNLKVQAFAIWESNLSISQIAAVNAAVKNI